jgi:hypothetical protein
MTTTGSTAGRTTRLPSRAGGARFTGASASLKVVSGASALGTTDTNTAAANKKRTDIQRSRFTAHITPKCLQSTPAILACQSCFRATKPHLARPESSAGGLSASVLMRRKLSLSSFVSARFLSSCMGRSSSRDQSERIRYFGFSVAGPETVVEWARAA